MYLPPPVRRRLDARDARVRAEGVRAGMARMRARRARDRYRYVFVVTYGRSGSTLVQGLLNTMPRTLVRGENDLYVLHLYRALASIRAFREEHALHGAFDDTSAFYGVRAIRPRYVVQAMNDVVTRSIIGAFDANDYDVVGFKEVVWHHVLPSETAGFFDALDEAFPGARYVLNTRDPDQVLGSGFWRRTDEDEARQLIARVVEIQEHLRATRPDRVFDVRYEVLTGDDAGARDDAVRGLGEFVTGRPVDTELLATLHGTLGKGHGPNPFARDRGREDMS